MSEQAKPAQGENKTPFLFYAVSVLLIGSFLWRIATPAHEYMMRTEQVMQMVLDGGLLIGLFGLRTKGPQALFWAAVIAGVGLFLIRMHSDASWWTGHWSYSLSPR